MPLRQKSSGVPWSLGVIWGSQGWSKQNCSHDPLAGSTHFKRAKGIPRSHWVILQIRNGVWKYSFTQQLKRDSFCWNRDAEKAFNALKQAMTTVLVLALPNFAKPFVIKTDASGHGLGAVLMQEGKPIAYFSQTLSDRACLHSIYERELMVIVLAVKKWRHYVLVRWFIVHTDQKSLKFLLEQHVINEEFQCWVTKLTGFDFEIQYWSGPNNKAADALSRSVPDVVLAALTVPTLFDITALTQQVDQDPHLCKVKQELARDPDSYPRFSLAQGRLLYKGRLVVPQGSSFIPLLLQEFHSTPIGGQSGFLRTYKRIVADLYWKGMKQDVKKFVDECQVCQQSKTQTLSAAGLLQPLPIPSWVWEDITMDFVEGLPKSGGFDSILLVVDHLCKYARFSALKHPFTAHTMPSFSFEMLSSSMVFPVPSFQIESKCSCVISGRSYLNCKALCFIKVQPVTLKRMAKPR